MSDISEFEEICYRIVLLASSRADVADRLRGALVRLSLLRQIARGSARDRARILALRINLVKVIDMSDIAVQS
jgi:hypothetical protein